ncbi:MAG: ATP-binding protein, partial [Thiohalomonadales bacterium]
MSIFQRQLVKQLIDRLAETPNYIQIVRGPRQTGKTTLVRQACEEIYSRTGKPNLFYAVDNPVLLNLAQTLDVGYEEQIVAPNNPDVEWLVYQWEKARSIARSEKGRENGLVLVFDEIQKIPNWSEAVKGLWDEDHSEKLNLHIVLLGSSPLLMQQGLSESLVGRYENLDSCHWSYLEMSEAFNFNIDEYIYFGGYPGAASFIRNVQRWKDYVQGSLIDPYLLKDILVMARVDKPALLINAFELSCEYSGQIMALTKMKGQLQNAGNETTIANYLFLLSKAGLVTAIQKYSGSTIRQRASIPKLNVMNTGLMACYSGYTFEQAKADRTYWGRMVESA